MVRKILNGVYANTAFCIFDPQGKRRLSRAGRSPTSVMGRGASDTNEGIIREMKRIASRYKPKASEKETVLQDFLSFRQALNVAAADQRLLVFVNADKDAVEEISPTLTKLFADEEIIGRFHLDFAGDEDEKWSQSIEVTKSKGAKSKPAINVIRSGKFGLDGQLMEQLSLDSSFDELKKKLLASNKKFGSTEERKDYANHVMEGKRKGIKYESEIPYGEDRDGDGKIDRRGKNGGNRGGGRGGRRGRGQ